MLKCCGSAAYNSEGPGSGAALVPLSRELWADVGTVVPVVEQDGCIATPFDSIQDAINFAFATAPGDQWLIHAVPGTYAEAITIANGMVLFFASQSRDQTEQQGNFTIGENAVVFVQGMGIGDAKLKQGAALTLDNASVETVDTVGVGIPVSVVLKNLSIVSDGDLDLSGLAGSTVTLLEGSIASNILADTVSLRDGSTAADITATSTVMAWDSEIENIFGGTVFPAAEITLRDTRVNHLIQGGEILCIDCVLANSVATDTITSAGSVVRLINTNISRAAVAFAIATQALELDFQTYYFWQSGSGQTVTNGEISFVEIDPTGGLVRANVLGAGNTLQAINTTPLVNGTQCYVTAEGISYTYSTTADLTAFGVYIVTPTTGPGQWYRGGRAQALSDSDVLWINNQNGGSSTLLGFTAGQRTATNNAAPDIILNTGFDGGNNIFAECFDKDLNLYCVSSSGIVAQFLHSATLASGTPAANAKLQAVADSPLGLAIGPNGSLWVRGLGTLAAYPQESFKASGTTPTGVPFVSLAGSNWNACTALFFDARGNVWCTSTNTNEVTKTTAEQLSLSDTTHRPAVVWTGFNEPYALTTGPDGNLWFVERGGGTIKKANPNQASGVPTILLTITTAGPAMTPSSIQFDAAGTMWVLDRTNQRVLGFLPATYASGGVKVPDIILSGGGQIGANARNLRFYRDPGVSGGGNGACTQTLTSSTAEISLGNSGAALNVDWSKALEYFATLSANCTLTFTGAPPDGSRLHFRVQQDATGGRTLAWPNTVTFLGGINGNGANTGSNPQPIPAATAYDLIVLEYVNGRYYAWYPPTPNAEFDAGNSGAGATPDWQRARNIKYTLTANCTFTFLAVGAQRPGTLVTLKLVQDGTGGRTVTWPAAVKNSPPVDLTASSTTIITFYYDGSNYWPMTQELPLLNDGNTGAGQTFNFALNRKHVATLTAATVTFAFTAPPSGSEVTIKMIQDGTGGRLVAWPGTAKFPSGVAPVLSVAASAVDLIKFLYDGTNYLMLDFVGDVR